MRELTLQEIQARELAIAEQVIEWMERNGINYSLSGGTLLGAIRHNGFIPWDDDIDICVPRPDYQRMLKLLRAGQFQIRDIGFGYPGKKGYFHSFVKFMDMNTICKRTFMRPGYDAPLWIDVFPMDRLPLNEAKYDRHMRTFLTLRYILWTECTQRETHVRFRGPSWKRKVRWWVYRAVDILLGGHRTLTRLIDFHARFIDWRNRKSQRWGNITWTSYLKDYADMPDGFETQYHAFECERFRVMRHYDQYLTVVYGDYMTPPPPNRRARGHDQKVYALDQEA